MGSIELIRSGIYGLVVGCPVGPGGLEPERNGCTSGDNENARTNNTIMA